MITLGSTATATDILARAIDDGGNLAGDANAARCILVELALAGSCDDCFSIVVAAMTSIFLSGTRVELSLPLRLCR